MKNKKFLKKINQGIKSEGIAQLLEKKKKLLTPLWSQKDNDNNNIVELGRSMVEMLGVLAVVGVISVGGIAGYNYAMNRYRANQVLNEVNLTSHLLATTLLNGEVQALTLDSPYGNGRMLSGAYSFEFGCADDECQEDETGYYITIGSVPEAVCRHIVNNGSNFQYQVDFVTGTEADACVVGDNNILEWAFDVSEVGEGGMSDTPDIDDNCNGHGTWCGDYCDCDTGWGGERCDICGSECSGHGYWCGSRCICDDGWCGEQCEMDLCNGHGTRDNGYCGCLCDTGWAGERCEILADDSCSGHGWLCGSTCVCNFGWVGDWCDIDRREYCNNHGILWMCGSYCDCDTGWCGTRCETDIGGGVCNGHGTWCGDYCDCDDGWYGIQCEIQD